MRMRTCLAVGASFAALSLLANEWYVDAVNGNDEWDGSTSNLTETASNIGPRKTLAGAMAIPTLAENDTVWALPGDYNAGFDWYYGTNRCYIAKPGLKLKSTHGPKVTFVTGDLSPEYKPNGNFNVPPNGDRQHDYTYYTNLTSQARCIAIDAKATGVIVEGFTLRNGLVPYRVDGTSLPADPATYGGGVLDHSRTAWIIDCVITNCYASRGGAIWGANAAQCQFLRCRSGGRGSNCDSRYFVNCLFRNPQSQPPVTYEKNDAPYATIVNCTFVDTSTKGYLNYKVQNVYNSILVGGTASEYWDGLGQQGRFYGEVANSVIGSGAFTNTTGSAVNEATCVTGATKDDVRFASLARNDYRVAPGSVAIGIGDAKWLLEIPLPDGYEYRDLRGRLLPTSGTIDAGCAQSETLVRYADCVNGDDQNDGKTLATAKKTIRAGLEELADGDRLLVAPGTYAAADECAGVGSETDPVRSCVSLLANVTMESLEGPEKTIIVGADGDSETQTGYVRCVHIDDGAVIRGFTLTGGRVVRVKVSQTSLLSGAAVYGDGTMTAKVVDCIISNNVGYSYTSYRVHLENCRILENEAVDTGVAGYLCSYRNCFIDYNRGNHVCFNPIAPFENCTFGAHNEITQGNTAQVFSYNSVAYPPVLVNCLVVAGRAWRTSGLENVCAATNSVIHSGICSDAYFAADMCVDCIRDKNTGTLMQWIDGDNRPVSENLIDTGANGLVTFDLEGKDLDGVPRCMNGVLDIGAFEKDRRMDFAAALGKKLVVTNATSAVRLTDGALVVPVGGLEGSFQGTGDAQLTFAVSGSGTLSAFVNGENVSTATGASATLDFGLVKTGDTFKVVFEPAEGVEAEARLASLRLFAGLQLLLR